MARARNIKPGFYKNEELAECSIWARYIYPGLWQLADREGRLEDRPKRIKGELLPFDSHDADKLLAELHERKFILRYEVDGRKCIWIIAFRKHQNPHHREPQSALPPPPESLRLQWLGTTVKPEAPDIFQGGAAQGQPRSGPAESPILNPESLIPHPPSGIASQGRAAGAEAGVATWNGYASAYQRVYGVQPVRNARVNGQIAQFVKRIPAADAPAVAEFYLDHKLVAYVRAQHPVGFLLRDAEGLYTQWKTGTRVTDTAARQADKSGAGIDQINRLLAEAQSTRRHD